MTFVNISMYMPGCQGEKLQKILSVAILVYDEQKEKNKGDNDERMKEN